MTLSNSEKFALRQKISDYAKEIGFDLVGFSPAKIEEKYLVAFDDWLENGREGSMEYMKKIEQRRDLTKILPGAKSVIVFAMNYYHEQPALKRGHGHVARYAYGRDYHKVIGKKLKMVEKFIMGAAPLPLLTKSYVDTGPILERALAEQAGLGRIGKNSLLITEKFGSWVFLSEIITTLDLNLSPVKLFGMTHSSIDTSQSAKSSLGRISNPQNRLSTGEPESLTSSRWSSPAQKSFNVCGNCTRCMTACPTGAIIAPGVVDARLCISYLTIENKKKIPAKLAKIIKKTKRLYGCDICQEVCPHNSARQRSKIDSTSTIESQQNSLDGLFTSIAGDSLDIKKVLTKTCSSDDTFLKTFAGSPVMRAKRKGLKRTAKIF